MAKETAEQKLLRLIEQGGGGGAEALSGPADEARKTLKAVQSVGGAFAIPGFLPGFSPRIGKLFHSPFQGGFGIREMNAVLMAAVAGMGVFFFMSMARGFEAARQSVEFEDVQPVSVSAENFLPMFADLKQYVAAVSVRNIFTPFEKKEIVQGEAAESPAVAVSRRILGRTETLRLVGISWLDSPSTASAMVENIASGVTYFLRSGENINGVRVESIYADSIVLEFEGERMELKL